MFHDGELIFLLYY